MPSDPDHVLDAIDGVVDEWETLSADAMRWAPPESKTPDLITEVSEIFGPLVNAFSQALRPVGDALERVLNSLEEPDGPRE
ncbi:hypothetical protein ACGFJC_28265 [Nonomuraea fuscirosea]|jgi:hypothetical protein|uniref:Uncharacterized protein n=1 Tax=Nonomuraea fuscirosea TaxID=1291556 RepID=A0A2T0MPU2_9ACTN|nr:hypothetical protein [Nonomuraea fuscirosea]PRX60051.1 hypothetical protein B0I32_118195 [Nonomuraea fuscirosea]